MMLEIMAGRALKDVLAQLVITVAGWARHIKEKCYVLHGYPPGHILHNSSQTKDVKPAINEQSNISPNLTAQSFTPD